MKQLIGMQKCSRSHLQEPGSSIEHLQLSPGEHGRWSVRSVGKHPAYISRPPQCAIVHEEGDTVIAAKRKHLGVIVILFAVNSVKQTGKLHEQNHVDIPLLIMFTKFVYHRSSGHNPIFEQ